MSNGLKMAWMSHRDYTCDTKYTFSKHSQDRMKERGISIADVYSSSPAERPVLITSTGGLSQKVITTYREAPKPLVKKLKGLGNFPKELSKSVPLPPSLIQVMIAEAPLFSKQHRCKINVYREFNCVKVSVREERYLQPIVEIIKEFAVSGVVSELRPPEVPKQPSNSKVKEEEKEKRTVVSENGPRVTNGNSVTRKQLLLERKPNEVPAIQPITAVHRNKRLGVLLANTILEGMEANA